MGEDAFRLIELMALSTGVFLGIHYLTSAHKYRPKIYLGWFMLISFFPDLVLTFLETGHINEDHIWMFPSFSLLYIPFLYFYARGIAGTFNSKLWLWLLPSVVLYPFQIAGMYWEWEVFLNLEILFAYGFNIYILVLLLKTLKRHQKNIFNYYSSIEDKSLNWLRDLAYIMIGFNALWLMEDLIYGFSDLELFFPEISLLATFITIYWIGFKSLRQPDFFIPNKPIIQIQEASDLSDSELKLFTTLEGLMKSEMIFKNPDLNLRTLADRLQTSDKVLSKIINNRIQNNFYHYINTYRVDAFKNALIHQVNNELTLFGLAQEFGFKSKSTFYAVFKKMEQQTPSEFQKNLKSD